MQDRYDAIYQGHRWKVPEFFNIAAPCCARWAGDASRIAMYCEHADGSTQTVTYAALQRDANRLANALANLGVARGDRVAIILPQGVETAVAHLAAYQLGVVAMPLSVLFGPDALEYRLQDSGAVVVIADATGLDNLAGIRAACPALRDVIAVDARDFAGSTANWHDLLDAASPDFTPVATRATEAAVLIYTSGTTGPPKGALIPHQALLGNLTGFVQSQNGFPREGDVFWSPADWAWTGGLMDALLPTLYFGMPIVGATAKKGARFDALAAFALLQKYRVTNTFLFPTALKIMMKAVPAPREHYDLALRAIMSAGEAVGSAVFDWCRDTLGVTVNEMFGQTEINYIVGNSCEQWPARSGSIGRPYPGHRVAVIDDDGALCKPGETGEVAAHRYDIHGDPDPVFFLGYWNNAAATEGKYSGDWCRTGDLALVDADGYLWYQGRADDMFKAAGYRIGPSEIENCLVRHPAVANAAVVPSPDAERGNVVKAYIVLAPDFLASDSLVHALQEHVRGKLAPYEYPREIEFIDALPMTTTGKVQRRVLRLREQERKRLAATGEAGPG